MSNLAPVYASGVIFLNLDFDSLIVDIVDRHTCEVIFFVVVIIVSILLMSVTVVLLLIGRGEVRRPINLPALSYRVKTNFLAFTQQSARRTAADSWSFGAWDHRSHGFVFDPPLRGAEAWFFASSV